MTQLDKSNVINTIINGAIGFVLSTLAAIFIVVPALYIYYHLNCADLAGIWVLCAAVIVYLTGMCAVFNDKIWK